MSSNVFIIAEVSANHNNDLELAKKTIRSIAETGADAVKIQTYKASSLTLDLSDGHFAPKESGLWKGYTPWNLYQEASMPYEWHQPLMELTHELGMVFFSSPFDFEAVDLLESLNVPMYKIASPEITDTPLIKYAASKGKPMIMSTGMADEGDIQRAIDACREVGNEDITILKCTSQYPASIGDANLLTIPDMKERFGVKVGVSDHTMGGVVPTVAVSLGATVVEKHFILDRSLGGPDSAFSMQPAEFKEMVDWVRNAEQALGKVTYDLKEENKLRRRSVFVTNDIKKGETLTKENIRSIRPGHGAHPSILEEAIGQTADRDWKKGEPFEWEGK